MNQSRSVAESQARTAAASIYLVGQDLEGHWLALETHGRGGGFFVSREAALGFAGFETGHDPQAICEAKGPIAFDLGSACRM